MAVVLLGLPNLALQFRALKPDDFLARQKSAGNDLGLPRQNPKLVPCWGPYQK